MAPKTRAEIQRALYRERKREQGGVAKKPRKTRSENQRAYRERNKLENNEKYLQWERDRKRQAYIPAALLTENETATQRKLNKEKAKRFRERRMQSKQPTTSTGDANQPHKMIVKMDFKWKKMALTRKWISRGVAKAHKKVKSLQEKNVQLQQKTWTLKKQLQ